MLMDLAKKLNQGIEAAEAGDKKRARQLLKEVVKTDETQVEAWLWLSQIVDSLEEREVCLENILTLEPDNPFAREELAQVKAEQEEFFAPVYLSEEEDTSAQVVEPAETLVGDPVAEADEFDNPWLCPYCLALTKPTDKKCPACAKPLIIRKRVTEERTVWLWRTIFLQLTVGFFSLAAGAGLFTLIVKLNGVFSPIPFLPAYVGLPTDQPDHLTEFVLALFPRWVFWGVITFGVYSFVLMVLLYMRIPYGNVLYLISGCVLLVMGLFTAVFYYSSLIAVVVGVVLFILGAVQILLSYSLWNDFLFEEGRLHLTLDRGVKTSANFFMSGRKYIKLKMWGLAVIHLRQATFMASKNVTYHAFLAMAYMRVKHYGLAERIIAKINTFAPNTPEVWQLQKELDVRRNS